MRRSLLALVLLLVSAPAAAHKVGTVLLEIDARAGGHVDLSLKAALDPDNRPSAVTFAFQPACARRGPARASRLDDAVLRRWPLHCPGGLAGRQLQLRGLDLTTPDALILVRHADGSRSRHSLNRQAPTLLLQAQDSHAVVGLWPWFGIGVEHILLGPDHLLFVLGLLLLLRNERRGWRLLVVTITAFTIAHSLTLALAVLGGASLPSRPVEIVIALSILLLALEVARARPDRPPTLTQRWPPLVAFGFGLLHGFGFAGALAELGVPQADAGWVLLLFNLGVEAGQLLFVAAAWSLLALLGRRPGLLAATQAVALRGLGGFAVFWVLERSWPLLQALA